MTRLALALFAVITLFAAALALATPAPVKAPWLLDCAGAAIGLPFLATPQNLEQHFGARNYVFRDLDEGEGFMTPGAILFPHDPQRALAVLWTDSTRTKTLSIHPWQDHYDPALSARSLWHARLGIRFGTSLRELERLNGRPFILSGFGWDYSGTAYDWRGGKLQAALSGSQCRVLVRLSQPPSNQPQLLGDRPLCSNRRDLQALNPRVGEWLVAFGSNPTPHNPPPACPAK